MSEKTFAKLAAIGGLIVISGAAFAQNATVTVVRPVAQTEVISTVDPDTSQDENAAVGMTTGIIAGAIVGGPIGAVVGGVGGAILGAASDVPEPVVSYVRANPMEPLYLDGEVVVGASLPETVQLQTVPDTEYQYVYVNGVPAVVEPGTRRIVHIIR